MSESSSAKTSLRDTIEAIIADRTASRREWADNVLGGGEQGERWFNAASPIIYASELRDILDGKGFTPSQPSTVTLAAVTTRFRQEKKQRHKAAGQ